MSIAVKTQSKASADHKTAGGKQEKKNSPEQFQDTEKPLLSPVIQTKLTTGQPGDHYDKEAGTMQHRSIQMKRNKELPAAVQVKMESAFGASFSNVNIHKNSSRARDLNALAFTQGNNVHFAPGQFNPNSQKGQELIGHEFAHVKQQRAGRVSPTSQYRGTPINDNSALEHEANIMGAKAMSHTVPAFGSAVSKTHAGSPGSTAPIQRFEAALHESVEYNALQDGGFTQKEAQLTYYGNWMRDVNQAFVPAAEQIGVDVIYAALSYVAYQKFGKIPTAEQLGFYLPAEHIDNPAGQVEGADYYTSPPSIPQSLQNSATGTPRPSKYVTPQEDTDPTTATVGGAKLFSADESGVMAFIRRTNAHVERRLELAAVSGRNEEGMLHLGAALHAVEDLFAHSNYVEIAINKLLKEDSSLLPNVTRPEDRHAEIFSPEIEVPKQNGAPGEKEMRPVLTTGSFTFNDTVESVGHEAIHILREPVKKPASKEEREALRRFMETLIKRFDSKLKGDQNFRQEVTKALVNIAKKANADVWGLETTINGALRLTPIVEIYLLQGRIAELLPEEVRKRLDEVQYEIAKLVQVRLMVPAAKRMQDLMLESHVSDTSMLEEFKRQRETVMEADRMKKVLKKYYTESEEAKAARKKVAHLENTPEQIVAGPSHTQITKDHKNSPFFGIAFRLAYEADKIIRDKILKVWGNTPYKPTGKPDALEPERIKAAGESKATAEKILAHGYDPGVKPDLTKTQAPLANLLKDIGLQIDQLNSMLQKHDGSNGGDDLKSIADKHKVSGIAQLFIKKAGFVTKARNFREREELIHNEIEVADKKLDALWKALKPYMTSFLGVTPAKYALIPPQYARIKANIIKALLEAKPGYTVEQHDILHGRKHIPNNNKKMPNLEVNTLTMPKINTGNLKIDDLLKTSRVLIGHPYDSNWWEQPVRDYITKHPDIVATYIKARNLGYTSFKK